MHWSAHNLAERSGKKNNIKYGWLHTISPTKPLTDIAFHFTTTFHPLPDFISYWLQSLLCEFFSLLSLWNHQHWWKGAFLEPPHYQRISEIILLYTPNSYNIYWHKERLVKICFRLLSQTKIHSNSPCLSIIDKLR